MIPPLPESKWDRSCAAHLLRRSAFGADPATVDRFAAMGRGRAVTVLVDGVEDSDLFPLPPALQDIEGFAAMRRAVAESRKDPEKQQSARRTLLRAEASAIVELRGWWLRRMRFSTHPLRETMTLFWHGHFTSGVRKVRSSHAMAFQNETLRVHALGDFRTLTCAIAKDPAMMRYLDVDGSSSKKPNENFARELMELFLLGEGNYTEEDIREAARAFTGYRVDPGSGRVLFREARHDAGPIRMFGKELPSTPDGVVETLIARPACAPYVAGRLWAFLSGHEAPPGLAHSLGETFRASGFDLKRLTTTILSSSQFYEQEIRGTQITSPVQWLVGSAKALEVPVVGNRQEVAALSQLGQELFEPPNVKGWEGGRAWIGASMFLARCNLAKSLFLDPKGAGERRPDFEKLAGLSERRDPRTLSDNLLARLLPVPPSPPTRAALVAAAASRSYPATDETVSEITGLIMATPEFQLA